MSNLLDASGNPIHSSSEGEKKLLTPGERRKILSLNRSYIVDTLFPCGSVHLWGGASGMGKSTLMFQTLYEWDRAQPVFGGYKSHPCEWVYVSGDRSLIETNATLDRLGYSNWDFPCYAMEDLAPRDSGGYISEEPTIFHIAEKFPNVKLIVLEGLQGFLPNTQRGQSQNKAEQLWLMRLRDQILNRGITIFATTHTAKNPSEAGKGAKRNNFLGSAALIGGCSTCVAFDIPLEQQVPGAKRPAYNDVNERMVTLMGRDFADIQLNYSRATNGAFVLESSKRENKVTVETTPDDRELQLELALMAYPHEVVLKSAELKMWGMKAGVNEKQMYAWLKGHIADGSVKQLVTRGSYQRVRAI